MAHPAQHLSAPMHVSEQYHVAAGHSLDRKDVAQADNDMLHLHYPPSLEQVFIQP